MAEKKETKENAQQHVSRAYEPVTVFVPRIPGVKDDKVVCVGEKRYIIKRGEPVTVPHCVAEVLEHEQRMQQQAYEYEEQLRERAANRAMS